MTVHLITESARVAKETERYTAWTHWTKFSLSGYWVMNGRAVYTAQIFWKTTYLITEIAHGRETHWHGYNKQLIWWLRQTLSSLQEGSAHSTETLNRGNSHLGQEAGGWRGIIWSTWDCAYLKLKSGLVPQSNIFGLRLISGKWYCRKRIRE